MANSYIFLMEKVNPQDSYAHSPVVLHLPIIVLLILILFVFFLMILH